MLTNVNSATIFLLTDVNASATERRMPRPRHSKPEIEAALSEAESVGWRIEKASPRAKPWGSARCAYANRDGCRLSILSTPKSAQNFAKQIRKAVAACPHLGSGEEDVAMEADYTKEKGKG